MGRQGFTSAVADVRLCARSRLRGVSLLGVAIAVGLVISACGSSTSSASTSGLTLRIGNLMPFTGPLSAFGPPLDSATRLAAADINAAIKQDGLGNKYSVRIVDTEDSEDSVAAAVEGAQKLLSSGVNVIDGTLDSGTTVAVAESVSIPNHLVQITPTSSANAITKLPDHLVYQVNVPDSFQSKEYVKALQSAYGSSALINVGYSNDESDSAAAKLFTQLWKQSGGRVGQVVGWNLNSPTYTSVAHQLASGHPNAWLILTLSQEYQKIATALAQTGKWNPAKTWGAEDMRALPVLKGLGPRLAGGLHGAAPALGDSALQKDLAAQFTQKYPHVQQTGYEPFAFDSVVVAFLAALKAHSTSGPAIAREIRAVTNPPGTTYNYLDLSGAIKAILAGKPVDYQGVSGPLAIGPDDAPTEALYTIWEYTPAGKLVALKTATVS